MAEDTLEESESLKGPSANRISLDNIFLDPNNYRFRDHNDYIFVPEEDISSPIVQSRTRRMILGGKNTRKGVSDLLSSFKKVGFQPVERIKVQRFGKGKYKVIEGNRRTTALKILQEEFNNSNDIGIFPSDFFEKVPVDIFSEKDSANYYLMAGLNHIGGKVKWPAINIATYIQDLEQQEGLDVEEICETFGVSKQQYNYYKRALSLIGEYKKSDYGDQFTSDMYFIFEEIVKTPSIRDYWLKWDTYIDKPINIENMNRLFGWMSDREIRINPDEDDSEVSVIKPIINQGRDIRDLGKIIKDKDALDTMEETESLVDAIGGSSTVKKGVLGASIDRVDKSIAEIKNNKSLLTDSDKAKVKSLMESLDMIITNDDFKSITINNDAIQSVWEENSVLKLQSLKIIDYKLFDDFSIKNFNRINIFAGNNNIGKSTILEAISLVVKQNDLLNLIDLYRRRGKFHPNNISAFWLQKEIPETIKIEGMFNDKLCSVDIEKTYESEEDYNKQKYVTSFSANATYGLNHSESILRIYSGIDPRSDYTKLNSICNLAYSSPFSLQQPDDILNYYDKAVKLEIDNLIVELIRESGLDSKVDHIKLSRTIDVMRFNVQHRKIKPSPDLTNFGDGMQRIFYIALHFAAAQNGILLIDELENAIHHDLLIRFSRFIQQLSEVFNVQVFITSHSKECIDAFVKNDYKVNDVSFYRLEKLDENVVARFTSGDDFKNIVSGFNIDLRS